jgi:hypothetical protein
MLSRIVKLSSIVDEDNRLHSMLEENPFDLKHLDR